MAPYRDVIGYRRFGELCCLCLQVGLGSCKHGVVSKKNSVFVNDALAVANSARYVFTESEMGMACSAYGGEKRRRQGFGGET